MPSSVIESMNYNPECRTLQVIFISGKVYNYLQVPAGIYEEMQSAASKGTFLNQKIKTKFKFQKVR